MFKTHVPIDWIVALVDADYTPFDDAEVSEIEDFIKDLGEGAKVEFLIPSDKDLEQAEYKQFNGALTECINIGYNILK